MISFLRLFESLNIEKMILSSVGDVYGARKTYGICLFMAGVSMVIPLIVYLKFDRKYLFFYKLTFGAWNSFTSFFILFFLNGSFQVSLWSFETS